MPKQPAKYSAPTPTAGRYLERASYTWSEDSLRLFHTPTQNARRKFFYVQEAGYFRTAPPYFTERENLNSYLILYTLSGAGELRIGARQYTLQAGQAFWISCMERHYYACQAATNGPNAAPAENDGTWEFLWLHFNGEGAAGYYEEFLAGGQPPVVAAAGTECEALLRRLLRCTQQPDLPRAELLSSRLIVDLMTNLTLCRSIPAPSGEIMPAPVKRLLKEMELHFLEPFPLERAERCAGLSRYYLSREFHRCTGASIGEYLITLRLTYAKELLRHSDHTVEEIAYLCGMNHVSHFIRLFRDREGVTPLQFRKAWRER